MRAFDLASHKMYYSFNTMRHSKYKVRANKIQAASLKNNPNLSVPEFLLFKEKITRGEKAKKGKPPSYLGRGLRAQSSEAPAYNQIVACCGTDVKKLSPFKP